MLAAILIIGGSEFLRELDVLQEFFGYTFDPTQYRMLLVGLGMVAMMDRGAARTCCDTAPHDFS